MKYNNQLKVIITKDLRILNRIKQICRAAIESCEVKHIFKIDLVDDISQWRVLRDVM
jgi:hypothetical protein